MTIFHIAFERDWADAVASGSYTLSTRGKTLADEGFIHASRADQVLGVAANFYADVTDPLVLLEIDEALLTSPVVVEPVPGTDQAFPHIYGPLNPGAVTAVYPFTPGTLPPIER